MKKKYQIIYADPPWVYQDKSKSHGGGAESHYICTPTEELGKLIIPAEDNSILLMWCTYPQLEEGLKLIKMWGFKYKTVAFTWVKTNKIADTFFFGMGRYTRSNPEICLLAIKGKGIPRISTKIKNLQIHKIQGHSKKPWQIKEQIEELFGTEHNKLEMFAREKWPGWDVWGNEIKNEVKLLTKSNE